MLRRLTGALKRPAQQGREAADVLSRGSLGRAAALRGVPSRAASPACYSLKDFPNILTPARAPARQVPFMFKYAVDALTADPTGALASSASLVPLVPAAALLGYGAARTASSLCNELRNAVFAKVGLKCHLCHLQAQFLCKHCPSEQV